MKNLLLLWAVFIVTGGYHLSYHGIGLRKDRVFSERVVAKSKAHAVNTVLCMYRTAGRNHVFIETVEEVKK